MVAFDLLGIGDEFLVDMEECGLVEDGEQRSPLLEVNIYTTVREEAGRKPKRLLRRFGTKGLAALDMQESLCVEVGARFAGFLNFSLERLCRECQLR